MSDLSDLNLHPNDLSFGTFGETYLAKMALTNVKFQSSNDKIRGIQP